MAALPTRPIITIHSRWPSIEDSANPGYVVDFETSVQDVIDVIDQHPQRVSLSHGLKIFHRKIALRTELDGHYAHPVNSLASLAAMVGIESRSDIAI